MALDVDAVAIRQRRRWRHTVHGADPLARRVPPPDNRWQHGAIVLYLANDEALKRVGLPIPRPGRKTWPPYQEVGETLWREGWPGLLAPSAARPQDGLVLCLFRGGADGLLPSRPLPPSRVIRQRRLRPQA